MTLTCLLGRGTCMQVWLYPVQAEVRPRLRLVRGSALRA